MEIENRMERQLTSFHRHSDTSKVRRREIPDKAKVNKCDYKTLKKEHSSNDRS